MTSPSNLKLDCRQLRDTVNALGDFIAERGDIDPAHALLLRDDLDRARALVSDIDRAVDRPPQIGLLIAAGGAADSLLGALTGARHGQPLGLFAGGAVRLPVLSGLVAKAVQPGLDRRAADLGLAARIRLTRDDASITTGRSAETVGRMMANGTTAGTGNGTGAGDGTGTGTPKRASDSGIRIEILTLADVICVLSRAYFSHVKAHGAVPSVGEIMAAIAQTEHGDVTTAAQSGLAAHHVLALRAYLEQRFRDHPRLGILAATGYWSAFAALAPRATPEGRRRLASLLWGGLGDFDIVYSELAGAIERLNHATEVYCPADAVRTAAASGAGWGEAHPYSILSAHTLLTDHEAAGELLEVRSKFGQAVTVSRSILTALTREVTLSVDCEPTALLSSADFVQLPVACPDVVPRDGASRPFVGRTDDAAGSAPWLARALLQAKSLYLAETAVGRLDLTGLVLHLDDERSLPAQFAPIVADWIEQTQGQTPQARAASDTTLFVAVDATAAGTPLAPLDAFLGPSRLTSWLERWGNDSAFNNVFILAADRRDATLALPPSERGRLARDQARPQARAPGTAMVARDALADALGTGQWLRHVRDAAVAVDEALHASDGGITYLAQSLSAVDYGRARRHQLTARLTAGRTELTDTVDRLLYASAPDADHDWRHRAALATQARLRTASAENRLGHLIAALCPSERECSWLFERMVAKDAPETDGLLHRIASLQRLDGSADERLAARYAARVMAHWFASMRLTEHAVGSPQLFGFTQASFGHLLEELAVGAVRVGVADRIASGVARGLDRGLDRADLTTAAASRTAAVAAKVASDVIGGFLSNLGFDAPWSSRHPRRRGTLGAPLFERIAAVSAEDLATLQAARITLQFHADWCEGFGLMSEENVAASRGMRFEDSEFRELAELRSLLGANSRERAL